MTTPEGMRNLHLTIPTDLHETLVAFSESHDVTLRGVAEGVLRGAMALGQMERLMEKGYPLAIEAGLRDTRRPKVRRTWTRDAGEFTQPRADGSGRTVPLNRAAKWRAGPWTLMYRGDPRRGRYPSEGDGWWLYGPGQLEMTHVGMNRQAAQEAAEPIIQRWERFKAEARRLAVAAGLAFPTPDEQEEDPCPE